MLDLLTQLGTKIVNGGFRVYLDPVGHPFCLVRG